LLLHDESHALATSCNLSPFIVPLETVQWVQDALGLIRIKQTLQTLIVHLEEISVGIDTEWTRIDQVNCISTIQIATRQMDKNAHTTWIIDALAFRSSISATSVSCQDELSEFLMWLFHHTQIVCLVFSFSEDEKLLRHIIPDFSPSTSRVLDLQQLSISNGIGRAGRFPSLRLVFERLFQGSTIDKSLQRSDWSARPLHEQQLRYAAADALVLLLIHDQITASSHSHWIAGQSDDPAPAT